MPSEVKMHLRYFFSTVTRRDAVALGNDSFAPW